MEYYTGLADEESAAAAEPGYEFAGFEIVSSVKIALTSTGGDPALGRGAVTSMDEAFVPLSVMMRDMGTPPADLVDEEAGVHTYVTRFELESPVELDIGVDDDGRVLIGSNPPIYDVDTSYRPAYHRIRFTAERTEVLG